MTRVGLSSAWTFTQESVFMRWLVMPLTILATLAFAMGLVILPPDVVAEVVLYYVVVASAVMVVGLGSEWVLRRSLDGGVEREYY